MKNKNLILSIAVLVVAGLLIYFVVARADTLVGETLYVQTLTSDGEPTGTALVQVPFVKGADETLSLSISVDLNGDGTFGAEETLVSNMPATARKDWRGGFYVRVARPLESGMAARVSTGGTDYDIPVEASTLEFGNLLDLETVTDPENATKGWGVQTAQADSHIFEVSQEGVPDLDQRKAECGPTAAANSLISLVAKNGGEDLIPGDPQDFIENLKRHMNWTPENGTPPDDFVAGKNRWAAAAGVPIRTEKVGDADGLTTIDAIKDALKNGDAVELRIKFANAAGTEIITGHMVTVTGIQQGEGQTYLQINDPATPNSGTETVEVQQNVLTNYAWDQGLTILSWGFVQTWEGHPTGELFDTMTDEEIQGIRQFVGDEPQITVIEYQDNFIPVSQLYVGDEHPPHATGPGCPATHWHASGPVKSISGTTFTDPNPGGCGFGTLKEKPSIHINVPQRNTGGEGGGIEVEGLESIKQQ